MPHVIKVVILKISLPFCFNTHRKLFWEAKTALNERMEHSQ